MRFLFVDNIESSINGKYISGYKTITPETGYFYEAQDGLCFLPSLIGEALGQLAAWNVMSSLDFKKRPVAGIASKVNIYKPVFLHEKLTLEAFIENLDDDCVQYEAKASVGGDVVLTIENALGPLLPMDDFIDTNTVIEQYHSLFKPLNSEPSLKLPIPEDAFFRPFLNYDTFVLDGFNAHISGFIPANLSCFKDHFPKKPVLPMTLLIANVIDAAMTMLQGLNPEKKFLVSAVRKIKMNQFINPKDSITCKLFMKPNSDNLESIQAQCILNDKRICVLELLFKEL